MKQIINSIVVITLLFAGLFGTGCSSGSKSSSAPAAGATKIGVDTNGDGKTDGYLVDSNGDGIYEGVDTNGDGVADVALGAAGTVTSVGVDINGDGKIDGYLIDTNSDGIFDGMDTNADGKVDVTLSTSILTNADAVATDTTLLEVIYGANDTADSVKTNVTLAAKGANGTTIVWKSDKAAIVAADGIVTRPSYTNGDETVTLTATVAKGTDLKTKTFTLKVIKAPRTDAESVAEDKQNLTIVYAAFESAAGVLNDITLPVTGSCGTAISWSSDNAAVIAVSGDVNCPAGVDKLVTLTATITKGSVSETRTFTIKVIGVFTIGGSVSGLSADGLVLTLNGSEDLTVPSGAASYTFTTKVIGGSAYRVAVKKTPNNLRCVAVNATGTISGANITNANITASAADYTALFTQKDSLPDLSYGTNAFADLDGDGDQDLVMTGITSSGTYVARIYFNDGKGNFTKGAQSSDGTSPIFTGVGQSAIDIADVTGDGKLDIIICGYGSTSPYFHTKLYINNGTGTFTNSTQSSDGTATVKFTGVQYGAVKFADFNGDGYKDIILSGINSAGYPTTKMYLNNGIGTFSEWTSANSKLTDGFMNSSIAVADFDKDGDLDIIISGSRAVSYDTYLYLNNGGAVFTKSTQSFTGLYNCSTDIADVDGDGDIDFFISGSNAGGVYLSKLYLNNGDGTFAANTQSSDGTNPLFLGVGYSSVKFADIDGDGDSDIIVTGQASSSSYYNGTYLYINDGKGVYTKSGQSSDGSIGNLTGIYNCSVGAADIDGDGDIDLVLSGLKYIGNTGYQSTTVYRNNGKGFFSGIRPVQYGSQSYADVDKDGDLDLLVTGIDPGGTKRSDLYLNNGAGNFYNANAGLIGVEYSSSDFGDVNGDGYPDIIITGLSGTSTYSTFLYINDGTGKFTKSDQSSDGSSAKFTGVQYGSSVFFDVDNDGDNDLVITGLSGTSTYSAKLYINTNGTFAYDSATLMTGVWNSSIGVCDFDKDGDLDLVITGMTGSSSYSALIYTNNKVRTNYKGFNIGRLESLGTTSLTGVCYGSVSFGDVNADGFPDLFIAGSNASNTSRLYLNSGSTTALDPFTYSTQTITGVNYASSTFRDVDSDGDLDLLVVGYGASPYYYATLYTNNGSGTFTSQSAGLAGVNYGASSFADFNGDGKPDVIITGHNGTYPVAATYLNLFK